MKATFFLLLICCAHVLWAHPADLDRNNRLSAGELAGYAATSPDANLLQQALNIITSGDQGAYETLQIDGADVFLPIAANVTFAALGRYHAPPLTAIPVASLPAQATTWRAWAISSHNRLLPHPVAFTGTQVICPFLPEFAFAGTTVEIVFSPAGASHPDRISAGSLSIAPADATGTIGAAASISASLTAFVDDFSSLTGVDYRQFFTGQTSDLSSVTDPFEQLEIGAICQLADPNCPGSLPNLLAQLQSDPALGAEILPVLDVLAAAQSDQLTRIFDRLRTEFPSVTNGKNGPGSKKKPALQPRDGQAKSETFDAMGLIVAILDARVAEEMLNDPIFSPSAGAVNTGVGFAGPIGAAVSGSVGLTTAVLQARYERTAFQGPSSATLSADFSKLNFFQDNCDSPGMWTATATATSKEWRADKAVLDLALNSVSALGTAADAAKLANGLSAAGDVKAANAVWKEAAAFNADDVGLAASQFGAAESLKKAYDVSPEINTIVFPPKTWTGIVFDEKTAQIAANPDTLNTSVRTYRPQEVGTVRALVRVKEGLPAVNIQSSDPAAIELKEAVLTLSGCPTRYTPGQTYVIKAAVNNVEDPAQILNGVTFSADMGSLTMPVSNGSTSTVIWQAPDPAPEGFVTLMAATTTRALCVPDGAGPLTASCVMQKDSETVNLTVLNNKDCFAPGEETALLSVAAPTNGEQWDINFQLVSGNGTLTKTGPLTATLTAPGETVASVLASRIGGGPGDFDSTTVIFGCEELTEISATIAPSEDGTVWVLGFETANATYSVAGNVSDQNNVLTVNFTAATQAIFINDPEVPFGSVGLKKPLNFENPAFVDPGFVFSLTFPYRVEPHEFNPFASVLIPTADPTINSNTLGRDYKLDSLVPILRLDAGPIPGYQVNFEPRQPNQ